MMCSQTPFCARRVNAVWIAHVEPKCCGLIRMKPMPMVDDAKTPVPLSQEHTGARSSKLAHLRAVRAKTVPKELKAPDKSRVKIATRNASQ